MDPDASNRVYTVFLYTWRLAYMGNNMQLLRTVRTFQTLLASWTLHDGLQELGQDAAVRADVDRDFGLFNLRGRVHEVPAIRSRRTYRCNCRSTRPCGATFQNCFDYAVQFQCVTKQSPLTASAHSADRDTAQAVLQ